MAERERAEPDHERRVAVAEQRDVTDQSEHRPGDEPGADVAAGIAGRRRHADEQCHRQRLGPQFDRPTAAGDRPPVDERRHPGGDEEGSRDRHGSAL